METVSKLVTVFASVLVATSALTDIRLFAPQAWIGPDGTLSFADTSAVTVNVAHTLFRTFGLTKPSDADIIDFCNALGLNERNDLAGLHALYSEPVLIFLEDPTGNAIAFFANSGISVISHNPETRTIFEALLGASKTAALAYKPERFLRPQLRNSVSGRFFVPENFRFDPLIEAASTASQLKVSEAPIVFKQSDIPDLYPYLRTSNRNFDIQQIQNAVTKPVQLTLSEKAGFPNVFNSKVGAASANQDSETVNNENFKTNNALATTNLTTEGLQSLFVRNPLACARFARAVEDSGLPVSDETSSTAMKAASYLADEAADYVLKALLARNPEVGARIARQALREYSDINAFSRSGYIPNASPPSYSHVSTSAPTYTPTYTSSHIPTHAHTSSNTFAHTPTPTYMPAPTPTHPSPYITTSSHIPTPSHMPTSGSSNTHMHLCAHPTTTSSSSHMHSLTSAHMTAPTTTHVPAPTYTHVPTDTSARIHSSTSPYVHTATSIHVPLAASTYVSTPASTSTSSTSIHVPSATSTYVSTPASTSTSTQTSESKTQQTSTASTKSASTSTEVSTSSSTSTSTTVPSCMADGTCKEPQIYMYDPVTSKIYRLVTSGGTLPDIVPGNSTIPDNIPENTTKILMAEPKQIKETKSDVAKTDNKTKYQSTTHMTDQKQTNESKSESRKTEYRTHGKHQLTPYEYVRRSFSGLPQGSHQFGNSAHMLNALNAMSK